MAVTSCVMFILAEAVVITDPKLGAVGVATNRDGAARAEIMAAADAAMYRAKHAGGNGIGFASQSAVVAIPAYLQRRAEDQRPAS